MDPNSKLFYVKLEKGYEGSRDRKTVTAERAGRSSRYEEAREAPFLE